MRSAAAEAVGTALLLAAVVGSGIMGERLAGGNPGVALLANSLATGFALIALIIAFAPRSGAHFNPVVSGALALRGDFPAARLAGYVAAQFVGALLGVLAAHAMFDLPLLQASVTVRSSRSTARRRGWRRSRSAATLPRPTGLRRPPPSPTRRSPWRVALRRHLPASAWRTCRPS